MKKFLALILILCLFMPSVGLMAKERHGANPVIQKIMPSVGLMAKERRGANLEIEKKGGLQVRGELIAVKQNSLLLKGSVPGTDMSVDISDIKVVTIKKKSKTLLGAGIGFSIGAGSGYVITHQGITDRTSSERSTERLKGGLILGLLGSIAGAAIGQALGKDKTIQIEGRSDSEIKEVLEQLRKKARIPEYK